MHCPRCGAENPDHSQYCSLCLEVFGLEDPEMTTVEPAMDGYRTSYPSSFEAPVAQPVDPGWYSPGDALAAPPRSRAGDPSPSSDMYAAYGGGAPYGAAPPYPATPQSSTTAERPFDWGRALFQCVKMAVVAALMSVSLELVLSFVGLNAMMQGQFTVAMTWLLLALLIPVCFAGFASGYRIQRYGWASGLISVAMLAFLFRPLYYAFLGWLLYERFSFSAVFQWREPGVHPGPLPAARRAVGLARGKARDDRTPVLMNRAPIAVTGESGISLLLLDSEREGLLRRSRCFLP